MNRIEFEKQLLEEIVEKAWEDEIMMSKIVAKKHGWKPKEMNEARRRVANWCQGITRNVERRVSGVFECKTMVFGVKGQKHVVLIVEGKKEYIVDGTIKQFLPKQKRKVFSIKEYPLDLKEATTW